MIDFPDAPTVGQRVSSPDGAITWEWNGAVWHKETGLGGWVPPIDWLTLPEVYPGEQKVVGLVAVGASLIPTTLRTLSLAVVGDATIDWGDGTAPENVAAGVAVGHMYDPAALAGTATSEGWLQAIVTITPQAGSALTMIDWAAPYNAGWTLGQPVVDAVLGPAGCAWRGWTPTMQRIELKMPYDLAARGTGVPGVSPNVRQIIGEVLVTTSVSFSGCTKLEKFPKVSFPNGSITSDHWANMFGGCASMREPPDMGPVVSIMRRCDNIFRGCAMMERVPDWMANLPNLSQANGVFRECYSIRTCPPLNWPKCSTVDFAFYACATLHEVHFTNNAVDPGHGLVNYMFAGCASLEKITGLNFAYPDQQIIIYQPFISCDRLSWLGFVPGKGPRFTFSVTSCNLDAAALDDIYTQLQVVTGMSIDVRGNPGIVGHNPAIAQAKGWTVNMVVANDLPTIGIEVLEGVHAND